MAPVDQLTKLKHKLRIIPGDRMRIGAIGGGMKSLGGRGAANSGSLALSLAGGNADGGGIPSLCGLSLSCCEPS